MEAVASALLPESRREDVLGDLHERFASPFGYVRDAAQLIPIIIVSHALRSRRPVGSPATARPSASQGQRRAATVVVNWLALARPALFVGGWYVWLSMLGVFSRLRGAASGAGAEPD